MKMSLSESTVLAASWLAGAKLISRSVDILTLLILARFLLPADFGIVAMAMSAVLIAEAVAELPLLQALTRVPRLTRRLLDTAFTLAFIRGSVLALVLFLISWPLAAFYEEPRVQPLVVFLALAPVLRGLVSPKLAVYIRKLDFRPESAILLISRVSTLLVSALVVIITESYWAIAAGTLISPLVMITCSYAVAPYRPRFSLSGWSAFADIIGWNSLSQIFSASNWQMGRVLLGKIADKTTLGNYTMAANIVSIPQRALIMPLTRPLMSAFSKTRDPIKLRSGYLKTMSSVWLVASPIFITLALLSQPLVIMALGESWAGISHLLAFEAIAALLAVPFSILAPLAMSLNRTRLVAMRTGIELAIGLPVTIVAIVQYGVAGLVISRVGISLLMLLVHLFLIRQLIALSIAKQSHQLFRALLASVPLIISLLLFRPWIDALTIGAPLVLGTGLAATVSFVVYLSIVFGCWHLSGRPDGLEQQFLNLYKRLIIRRVFH
ncbi:oligosaccharide flippase family protein [Granulosicoccus sp. 3-233]|uniref:oligosaccharide flippase family protein n=1 Tax=Granulosicoccus sp. 3-233 TaxID=3417969 RepID=UPI003D326465